MKRSHDSEFGTRLRQAFRGASNVEIGKQIDYSPSQMTDVMAGRAYPSVDRLLRISELTKCSLHWLLTGAGVEKEDPYEFLGESAAMIVRELAEGREVDVAEMIRNLVERGLAARGAELFSRLPELSEGERRELRVLSDVVVEGGVLESPRPKGATRRGGSR